VRSSSFVARIHPAAALVVAQPFHAVSCFDSASTMYSILWQRAGQCSCCQQIPGLQQLQLLLGGTFARPAHVIRAQACRHAPRLVSPLSCRTLAGLPVTNLLSLGRTSCALIVCAAVLSSRSLCACPASICGRGALLCARA
jgi:hypothetical protein